MIEVRGLSKKFGNKTALNNVSFSVGKGSITGIVGRNGAGKTTLLKALVTIVDPDEGTVMINDQDIFREPKAKNKVMYVSDSVEALKNYSIQQITSLYRDVYDQFDEAYFQELLERFKMPKVKKIKNYSKGRKALFSLILAFASKPEYVLLDEPTDGLDVIVKKELMRFLVDEVSKEEMTIIIATHRLDELETLADQILVMKDGTMKETFQLHSLQEDYQKWQVVYQESMPEALKADVHILNQTGRVYSLLFEGEQEEGKAKIEATEPLLYEALPLSLEDIFVAKLGGEQIAE
ncbi:ABC transporter ATP-binding protein [Geomicrobium sediminis]|uniref:ABC-2 type transport system ATP-binding protein n=1 Tax=Geomicrobium sediminis TaxID=1347788 RepID=A0ABS2PC27_9BACL|nr:ABC transporter ATP-binding protein [Geomicrobium sediminis]MBM7632974.1 ABC-2 type transport system ATP-binding protein [Geomicrobium sediminis]